MELRVNGIICEAAPVTSWFPKGYVDVGLIQFLRYICFFCQRAYLQLRNFLPSNITLNFLKQKIITRQKIFVFSLSHKKEQLFLDQRIFFLQVCCWHCTSMETLGNVLFHIHMALIVKICNRIEKKSYDWSKRLSGFLGVGYISVFLLPCSTTRIP